MSTTTPATGELLEAIRGSLTSAYELGLQQIATPCRLPSPDQNSALRVLAFIAGNHPNWEPGETPEALAADPIAAELGAAVLALHTTAREVA